jgi:hypothetical protein
LLRYFRLRLMRLDPLLVELAISCWIDTVILDRLGIIIIGPDLFFNPRIMCRRPLLDAFIFRRLDVGVGRAFGLWQCLDGHVARQGR